jgi:hypothetical protein
MNDLLARLRWPLLRLFLLPELMLLVPRQSDLFCQQSSELSVMKVSRTLGPHTCLHELHYEL